MKQLFRSPERGQALILIAFAAIGLFAFTALAIDGSIIFSDRRHAQNAADTSALAAALAKTRGQDYVQAAKTRATSNGYNGTTSNVVSVYLCDDPAATCSALPTGADPKEYIQVKIDSTVKTYFARVIGWREIVNHVTAVAHAAPGTSTNLFGGNALVALNQDACPAFDYSGGGSIKVTGSGIFINSRCAAGSNQALDSDAAGTSLTVPCYNIVGGSTARPGTLTTTGGCANATNNSAAFIPYPATTYPTPNIPCDPSNTPTGNSSTSLNPGYYSGNTFPPSGTGVATMNPGIYCINIGNHDFSLTGGTELNGDGVLIYMMSGGISWTSGSYHLKAIYGKYSDGTDFPYNGLVLAMAPGNCNNVDIEGNGSDTFIGTILAPCSQVKLTGSSSSGVPQSFNNQIIADTISVSGGAGLVINYDASLQWIPPKQPFVEENQ